VLFRSRLGDEAALLSSAARLDGAVWSDDAVFPLDATVRVRARHDGEHAVIDREVDPATGAPVFIARFRTPVRAVSPGQVAVAYQGDRVVGGGTITRAMTLAEAHG
jgi:tRNA-specific 2-thiouridylase